MPYLETADVLRQDCVGPGLYELDVSAPQLASIAAPGQFVHMHVRPVWNGQRQSSAPAQPLLRRPFSISGVDSSVSGSITILYKVRGAGTELLANVRPGDRLDVMGPLGKGFTLPEPPPQHRPHALLVGGGLGIAPLVFLAHTLARSGHRATVFYGANTAGETQSALRRLQASGAGSIQVFTTTPDGSAGLAGIVTDLLTAEPSATALSDVDYIYTCGPEPMMAAVEQFAAARRIPGEMSLEAALACGTGACLGCARRLRAEPGASPAYARVCKDGPVFSFGQVELNLVPCGEE
ncbi:MAG: dihydroorotate dehydrogenase electron transfer subunit [Bacillota bacterium]